MSDDFFTRSPYLRNLEQNLIVDPWHSNLTFIDTLKGSNIRVQIATFSNTIPRSLTATNANVSQLSSGQVNVGSGTISNLAAISASLCNISACNIDTVELVARLVNAYSLVSTELSGASCSLSNILSYYVGSQLITTSNLLGQIATLSNVYSKYVKSTKIMGSNVFFNQLVDLGGHVVINSNSKLLWSNLKDIPERVTVV
jgi:hypothetical protein